MSLSRYVNFGKPEVLAWICLNRWEVSIILFYAIVQGYVDGGNSKVFCVLFGFVWARCVLLFLQFYGIYLSGILGFFFRALNKTARHSVTIFCQTTAVSTVSTNFVPIRKYTNQSFEHRQKFKYCSEWLKISDL